MNPQSAHTDNLPGPGFFTLFKVLLVLLILAGLCIGGALFLNSPPTHFSGRTSLTVESGEGVKNITASLQKASVVRSGTFLYLILNTFYDPKSIKASTYVFESPLSTFSVAQKLVTGDFDNDLLKFTHIEGERATDISTHAKEVLINFDDKRFLELAIPLEGKLYPDTYLIPKTFTADQLVQLMIKTFNEKTLSIQPKLESYSLKFGDILTLASILEREANSPESMKMVSDILQRRMEEGMALQTDASIEYVLHKPLKELTPEDLKVDSPYNTYTNRGLPPTPIGNPGLDAITAVLEPTPNNYVYYITDDNGVFHYARTFDEHKANVAKYLRK